MLTVMLGIDQRTARSTWTVFIIALLIWMTFAGRHAILLFILAIFFAYMLAPLVEYLDHLTPRRVSRKLSLAVVYTALIATLVIGGITFGSQLSDEANTLLAKLPDLMRGNSLETQPLPGWLEPYRARIID